MSLGYSVFASRLITRGAEGRVRVSFNERVLADGLQIIVTIGNTGRKAINMAAFDGPLYVHLGQGITALDASIARVHPASIKPDIRLLDPPDDSNREAGPAVAAVSPLLLNERSWVQIAFLAEGRREQVAAAVTGRVEGVSEIKHEWSVEDRLKERPWYKRTEVIAGGIVAAIALLGWLVLAGPLKPGPKPGDTVDLRLYASVDNYGFSRATCGVLVSKGSGKVPVVIKEPGPYGNLVSYNNAEVRSIKAHEGKCPPVRRTIGG